jgi:hypothetical protein
MLPKRARQIKPIDPKLPQRSIKIELGLNDDSAVGVDYLQSGPIRIDEVSIHMVQPRPRQTDKTTLTIGEALINEPIEHTRLRSS